MVGQTISHYKILSEVGRGGMGVVYKAEDTKLKRLVALKFLRSDVLEDEEHKERFLREAQAAAALDHPNICTVYEIDEADGQTFLSMAYLEGETVKEKIKARPLKLEEALDIAIQTAQGLQAAHEKGIVHRDIKSSNLMVTPQGQIKIMDFGLAQLADRSKLTKTTASLGTPSYMSPEQAQKSKTDRRTDIWSLGVVIYEMVTGRLPFEREREPAVLYSIVNEEPEVMTAQRVDVPVELDHIVSKAMAKDAGERYQHVEEMIVDLRGLSKRLASGKPNILTTGVGARHTTAGATNRAAASERLAWLVAAVFCAGLIIVSFLHLRQDRPEAPLRRFVVPTGALAIADNDLFADVAVSPDGRHIAFVEAGAEGKLWVQDLDQYEPRAIDGTERARFPFWAPGSDFIGFSTNREIKNVSVQGGSPILVCRKPASAGASWSPDGQMIVFASGLPSELYQVPARGGQPKLLISMQELQESLGEPVNYVARPHFLPSQAGARMLVFQFGGATTPEIMMVQNLETGRRERLGPGDFPFYSPSGHILHQPAFGVGQLWALPFSLDTLKATGEAFPIAENGRDPTVAADGTLVYSARARPGPSRLVWVSRQGEKTAEVGQAPEEALAVALSPDERLVAVTLDDGSNWDIWVHDLARGVRTRLTTSLGLDRAPVWSPSGQQIAYVSRRFGPTDIFLRPVGGSGEDETLRATPLYKETTDWSRDGKYLLYHRMGGETMFDLCYLRRAEDGGDWEQHLFLQTPFNEWGAALSPDGQHVGACPEFR